MSQSILKIIQETAAKAYGNDGTQFGTVVMSENTYKRLCRESVAVSWQTMNDPLNNAPSYLVSHVINPVTGRSIKVEQSDGQDDALLLFLPADGDPVGMTGVMIGDEVPA